MSKRILLFSLVLVTAAQAANEAGLKPTTVLVQTKMEYGTEVHFVVDGSDNFRVDLVTASCSIALRVDFQLDQNRITLNTWDGRGWGKEDRQSYHFENRTEAAIQRWIGFFDIRIGSTFAYRLATDTLGAGIDYRNITHVLLSGGKRNQLPLFHILVRPGRFDFDSEISGDWMQPDNDGGIEILGRKPFVGPNFDSKSKSKFTFDLMANDSLAMRMRYDFNASYIAGDGWVQEETNGTIALQQGEPFSVHLLAKENAYEMIVNGKKYTYVYHQVDPRSVDRVRVKVRGFKVRRLLYYLKYPRETTKAIPCRRMAVNAYCAAAAVKEDEDL